jgi:hypothetical protein
MQQTDNLRPRFAFGQNLCNVAGGFLSGPLESTWRVPNSLGKEWRSEILEDPGDGK